jgi:hypothetical protein
VKVGSSSRRDHSAVRRRLIVDEGIERVDKTKLYGLEGRPRISGGRRELSIYELELWSVTLGYAKPSR